MPVATGLAPEIWFPVITLILGALLTAFFSFLSDRRAANREREARAEQRRELIRQRRSDFQRATLIELQDALMALGRYTGSAHHELTMGTRAGTPIEKVRLSEEVNEGLRVAQGNVSRLRVRVRDDQLRKMAQTFSRAGTDAILAQDMGQADAGFQAMMQVIEPMQERIGHLIRTIDDDET